MKLTNAQEYKTNNNRLITEGVKFAKLNKQNVLSDYKTQVEAGDYNAEKVIVKKVVILDNMEWNVVTCNLLNGCESWDKIGGSTYIGDDPEIIIHKGFYELTENQQEDYRNNNATLTVLVLNRYTGETFYVNTEGHGYARYVGIK